MPDLATRRPPAAPARQVGTLPPAQSGMSIEDALEMTKVSRPEFALMAATTFKEARSLEELVSGIVFVQRRGLDALSKHVYFEKFDGSAPSLAVGIDGLRSMAAQTGRYAGSSEPVYRGTWEMPLDTGGKKIVPAQCLVVVWALVGGQKCAFEATAHMDESYPGTSGRGRMWRMWPKRMLAVAAERQALRKAFPSVLADIGDHEPTGPLEPEVDSAPPPRTSITAGLSDAEKARMYDEFFGQTGELPAPVQPLRRDPDPRQAQLLAEYHKLLGDALAKGAVTDAHEWALSSEQAPEVEIIEHGRALRAAVNAHTIASAQGLTTSEGAEPGGHTSPPPASPASVRSELWAENRWLTTKAVELGMRDMPTLNTRATNEELLAGNESLRSGIKAIEDDLVVETPEADAQQALV